ncbi:MAG: HAD-IA family hydrolase [Pseudomonadota bacterium]
MVEAVFFDLDGTLADTAPDLGGALNRLRKRNGLPLLPIPKIRPYASMGARGLLQIGFGLAPDAPNYAALRDEFLALYEANLCVETKLFPGMEELLSTLEMRRISWGIVTNKTTRFTNPLMKLLDLDERAACIISGDSTPHAKPHPEPLFAACRATSARPEHCIYVGDDERDTQAALAAGMRSIVAGYGYLNGSRPEAWGAHGIIQTPVELLNFL